MILFPSLYYIIFCWRWFILGLNNKC